MLLKMVERIATLVVAVLLLVVAARNQRYQERTTRASATMTRSAANSRRTITSTPTAPVAMSTKKALHSNYHSPDAITAP